jgi:hypothetical protein
MADKEDGRNFGEGCLWGGILSIPLWILIYLIFRKIFQ